METIPPPFWAVQTLGKFAGLAIFDIWKGKRIVRAKVDPSNPNTVPQQTQRGRFNDAKALYQATPFTDRDRQAFKTTARLFKRREGILANFIWQYFIFLLFPPAITVFHHVETRNLGNGVIRFEVQYLSGAFVYIAWARTFRLHNHLELMSEIGATGLYRLTINLGEHQRIWFAPIEGIVGPPGFRGITGLYYVRVE